VSMIVSNAIIGGLDFGDVRVVIPKSMILILIINLVLMEPYGIGRFLTAPIWLFGLMILFRIELWETRFLMLMNWLLNIGAKMLIAAALLTVFFGTKVAIDKSMGHGRPSNAQEAKELKTYVDKFNAEYRTDSCTEGTPVVQLRIVGNK